MGQLVDAAVVANNAPVGIVPDSLKFTEGTGEQKMLPESIGGGKVEQVYSHDVSSNVSKLMFSLRTTPDNIKLARSWKTNKNANLFQIAGTTPEGERVTRTFANAAVTNDYEVNVASEGTIDIEIMSDAAI